MRCSKSSENVSGGDAGVPKSCAGGSSAAGAVVLLVLLVQLIQLIGDRLVIKSDKRRR